MDVFFVFTVTFGFAFGLAGVVLFAFFIGVLPPSEVFFIQFAHMAM